MSSAALDSLTNMPCVASRDSDVLREILEDGVLLTRWERTAHPGAGPGLRALLQLRQPVGIDTKSREPEGFNQQLREAVGRAGLEEQSSLQVLAEDVCELASLFADISGRDHLRLRFERVEDDGCALFHVDTLPMRMLCTYFGPGTQWLEEDNVRRDQLGSRGRSLDEANAAMVIDSEKIQTAPAWHVLIFKGRLWDGHGYQDGLVHRSAPVRHPQDYRLRLTIDFSDSCAC